MTIKERRNPELIKASNKKRIAKGSGTTIQDVNALLKQFEQMKQMLKQLKGKTIYATGQGTTPEYTLRYLLSKAGLNARPGKITDKYCSPTKRLIQIPERIVTVIKRPGLFRCLTSGSIALCTMLNFMSIPPSDKVEMMSATVAIMLEIPPRVSNALTEASLVLATKPFMIKLFND